MKKSSKQDGCNFENWKIWPNTLNVHKLILFTQDLTQNQNNNTLPEQASDMIFQYIYEKGKNVSNIETCLEIARELNLNEN